MIVLPFLLTVASLSQFINETNAQKGQSLRTCARAGCVTEAVIDIRRADLERPDYEVLVEFDKVKQRCTLSTNEDVSPEVPNCGDQVRLVLRAVPCTSSQDEKKCALTPKIEEHLVIFATPAKIKVTLFQEGKEIVVDTLHPIYKSHLPYGEDCESGCKFWRTVWTIPGE